MPTNEDGEFELILGNRQLLSVFFIVVILLGVFFTMGYIVGRNSSPVATADANPARKSDTKPLVVDSPTPSTPEPAPRETRPDRDSTAPIATAQQQPPETPKPFKSDPVKAPPPPPKPEPVKAAKAEKAEKEKAEKEKAEKEKAEKAERKPVPAPSPTSGAPSGTYLQLAATTKREADIMVDVLRQKKFGALTAEIPEKPGLFRVLVGPMQEAQVNKTKTDLQSAGFPGDKSIKRNF